MARTALKTAEILTEFYHEAFCGDESEPFRISWPQLRSIAGVTKLSSNYLRRLNNVLNETKHFLLPLDGFLLVGEECDLTVFRVAPDRIVEEYLYDPEDDDDIEIDDLGAEEREEAVSCSGGKDALHEA